MSSERTYASYLKIPELLALQQRVSEPPQHDEMLFIIVHQVHELWFKQILHEIDASIVHLDGDRILAASRCLRRVHAIQLVLLEQIGVLETMTPHEFLAFRSGLNPASGFQSVQFREIEAVSGLRSPELLAAIKGDAPGKARLERRLGERTLYDALMAALVRRGLTGGRVDVFRRIYEAPDANYDLYTLLENFLDYDEAFMNWRALHVRMVERMIGMKRGTGGSSGVPYLASTLSRRFFNELWEVRTELGAGARYGEP